MPIQDLVVKEFTVTAEDIDELGHVNNRVYLRWIEEVARYASDVNGWTTQKYIENGFAWVAREHWIEYLRACVLGDVIRAYTWLQSRDESRCLRRYALKKGPKICCVGATEWDFIDLNTRRTTVCPERVAEHFRLVSKDDDRLVSLGISRPVRYAPQGFEDALS